MARVGYQGEPGAFSEVAVVTLFAAGDAVQPIPCRTFRDVFDGVEAGTLAFGVVPLENSQGGSIAETYDLLLRESVSIVGEVVVRVDQALLGLAGATLEGIRRVWSHPQALAQCEGFLARLGAEVVPMYDTAGAAKRVAEEARTDQAAVAAERAAEVYGLQVLAPRIQTHQDNQTRFAAIASGSAAGAVGVPPAPLGPPEKTSIVFGVRHVPGALVRALSTFAFRGLNLAKIESRPLGDRPWEYRFYVDVEAGMDDPLLADAVAELEREGRSIKVLGSYPRWRWPDEPDEPDEPEEPEEPEEPAD
jgi:prephenate dehydratase